MSDEVQIIRASEADDLFECSPSVTGPGMTRIRSTGEPAKLGKLVHSLAASYVETGTFNVANECSRRGWDDEDEVAKLIYFAAQAWDERRKFFRMPLCERVFSGPVLDTPTGQWRMQGTVDVFSPIYTDVRDDRDRLDKKASLAAAEASKRLVFLDWKSGRRDGGYSNQMFAYAYLLWNWKGRPDDIDLTGIVAFLRHRYCRVASYDAAALKAWEYDLTHNCLSRTDVYRPGAHCVECPIYHTCKAQQEMTRGAMTALMLPNHVAADDPRRLTISKGLDILERITPDNKGEPEVRELIAGLLARRRLGEKLLSELGDAMRRTVERVGPLPTGDGFSLVLRDVEIETLDPVKSAGVLKRHLSDAEVLSACRMSYPKIRAAKAAKFGRGEKKAARESMEKDLRDAGAVSVTVQQRLEELDLGTEQVTDVEHTAIDHAAKEPNDPRIGVDAPTVVGQRQLEKGGDGADRA